MTPLLKRYFQKRTRINVETAFSNFSFFDELPDLEKTRIENICQPRKNEKLYLIYKNESEHLLISTDGVFFLNKDKFGLKKLRNVQIYWKKITKSENPLKANKHFIRIAYQGLFERIDIYFLNKNEAQLFFDAIDCLLGLHKFDSTKERREMDLVEILESETKKRLSTKESCEIYNTLYNCLETCDIGTKQRISDKLFKKSFFSQEFIEEKLAPIKRVRQREKDDYLLNMTISHILKLELLEEEKGKKIDSEKLKKAFDNLNGREKIKAMKLIGHAFDVRYKRAFQ